MTIDFTSEKFDVVMDVYNNHREEYTQWVKEHGKECLNEYFENRDNPSVLTEVFAIFICTKFKEYQNGKVEG